MRFPFAAIAILALTSLSPFAQASGVEVCRLSGTVLTEPTRQDDNIFFELLVGESRPVKCHGFSSHAPDACAGYTDQRVPVGLAAADASSVVVGGVAELVQVVVDLQAGSHPGKETNWRPVSDCE